MRIRAVACAVGALPLLAAMIGLIVLAGRASPVGADDGGAGLSAAEWAAGMPAFDESSLIFGGSGAQGPTMRGTGIATTSGPEHRTSWELLLPAARIRADIVRMSLTAEGALAAPDNPEVIAWWEDGPRPGEPGNLLLDGHRDYTDIWGNVGLGVCWELSQTEPGDFVLIRDKRSDQSWVYQVTRSFALAWDSPAAEDLLRPTVDATLTLVTCEGTFDRATHNYSGRHVVTASLVQSAGTAAAGTRTVTLEPGWNLVGWTAPGVTPIASSGLAPLMERAFFWNAATQAFRFWASSLPPALNQTNALQFGQGAWVSVPAGGQTTVSLSSAVTGRWVSLRHEAEGGFNLVTWTGPDGISIAEATAGLTSALAAVFVWDAPAQRWLVYRPDEPPQLTTATTLRHGQALWALVERDAMWYHPAP